MDMNDIDVKNMKGLTLFNYEACPYGQRVWWLCEELNLKYNFIRVKIGTNKPKWYNASINKYGTVPCLYHNGKGIFESMNIIEYLLDIQCNCDDLMPKDPYIKAKCREIISKLDVSIFYRFIKCNDLENQLILKPQVILKLKELNDLYQMMNKDGPYFLGDKFSIVEIAIIPFIERFYVLFKYFRCLDITTLQINKLLNALNNVRERIAYKNTIPTESQLIEMYNEYYGLVITNELKLTNECDILCKMMRDQYKLGWCYGSSGSIALKKEHQLIVTPSGVSKNKLESKDLFIIDCRNDTNIYAPNNLKLSDSYKIFKVLLKNDGVVIHSHSFESVISALNNDQNVICINNYEIIKGVYGHHESIEIPIIENKSTESELVPDILLALTKYPKTFAIIVKNHGIYIWGNTIEQAQIHAECYHYLLKLFNYERRVNHFII